MASQQAMREQGHRATEAWDNIQTAMRHSYFRECNLPRGFSIEAYTRKSIYHDLYDEWTQQTAQLQRLMTEYQRLGGHVKVQVGSHNNQGLGEVDTLPFGCSLWDLVPSREGTGFALRRNRRERVWDEESGEEYIRDAPDLVIRSWDVNASGDGRYMAMKAVSPLELGQYLSVFPKQVIAANDFFFVGFIEVDNADVAFPVNLDCHSSILKVLRPYKHYSKTRGS